MSVATGWQVAVGAAITAQMYDPPGGLSEGVKLGARVEVPYTREIVSYYQHGVLEDTGDALIWTVTLLGVLYPGLFNLVWLSDDALPNEFEVFIPLNVVAGPVAGAGSGVPGQNYPPVDLAEVTPTVDDVAQLERTRTFDSYGNEYITFTDATRPTADEVLRVITDAVPVVLGTLPTYFDPKHWPAAKGVIALFCAMTIEGSWFKEQALVAGRAAGMPWELEYTTARDELEATINEDRDQNNLLGRMEPRQPGYAEPYTAPPAHGGVYRG